MGLIAGAGLLGSAASALPIDTPVATQTSQVQLAPAEPSPAPREPAPAETALPDEAPQEAPASEAPTTAPDPNVPTDEPPAPPSAVPTQAPVESDEPVEPSEAPNDDTTESPAPTVAPAIPPAAVNSQVSWVSWGIAAGVLIVGAVGFVLLRRRTLGHAAAAKTEAVDASEDSTSAPDSDGSAGSADLADPGAPEDPADPAQSHLAAESSESDAATGDPVVASAVVSPSIADTDESFVREQSPLPSVDMTDVIATAQAAAEPQSAHARATLAAMESVGVAMTDAGFSVTTIRNAVERIALVNGLDDAQVVVFPTALLVSVRGDDEVRTGAVTSGERSMRLDQVDELQRTIDAAAAGEIDPRETRRRIRALRTSPPPYSAMMRWLSYPLLSAALAVLLGSSWAGVLLAGVLGLGAGAAMLAGERLTGRYQALLTVLLAFSAALVVLLAIRFGLNNAALPALIAPLVLLLPGGRLTIGVLELATGQMVSGAGRVASGAMQLVLLAVGIVAAGALVGVPSLHTAETDPLGPIAPWIAVGVFGIGVVVYQCAPRSSLWWILIVLYVAYGAQVFGALFFGGGLSAFIGAFALTPVAALIARQPTGPAAFVSFIPGFWLLVPGALGLIGMAAMLGGEADGTNSLITTVATMVAISLGVLAGTALSSRLNRPAL